MKIKRLFIVLTIFIASSLSANVPLKLPPLSHPLKADFLVLTFPKSGTHLVRKLLYIIGCELGHSGANQYTWDHFFSTHSDYFPKGINPFFAVQSQDKPFIVVIRDLRDIIVSMVFWHTKMVHEVSNNGGVKWIPMSILNQWNAMSMEEKITTYIKGDFYPQYNNWGAFAVEQLKNMEAFLSILKSAVLIRYEDLVGPKGGGTLEAQVEAIFQVAELIGVSLTFDEVDYICENLFGCREKDRSMGYMATYREGGIGKWKDVFTAEHVALFKERYNDFLVEYGYEKDDQW